MLAKNNATSLLIQYYWAGKRYNNGSPSEPTETGIPIFQVAEQYSLRSIRYYPCWSRSLQLYYRNGHGEKHSLYDHNQSLVGFVGKPPRHKLALFYTQVLRPGGVMLRFRKRRRWTCHIYDACSEMPSIANRSATVRHIQYSVISCTFLLIDLPC
jgi:hypothetical protein